ISRFTNSYFYGMFSSVVAVIEVNYIFTYPYFNLNFTLSGYPLTFLVMFSVSIVVSMLTTQIKQQEKIRTEIEKEQMRANLLRAVSHDIRTPLTSIVGAVSAVAENHDKLSEEKTLSLLGDVKEEAQWLVRVVENLLLVTRIDADSAKVSKEPEPVEEILAEAVAKFKKRFPGAPIKTEMPEDVLFVPMDAMLIEQVLCNLLENAILHGGVVSEIHLNVRKDGESAVFSVADDGVGIAAEVLPRILSESIYRENSENIDGKRNMGIGLTVCQSIIKAHGGIIKAYNRKEGGAVFEFSLPIKEG
ncbi:MAG: PAS domain-containing sensor histidine kinase, partial [Lachnospiraceae bacterium]|nr:PAS domain-containing sensor histidine kinase [Lachnospiraceae bacterium]